MFYENKLRYTARNAKDNFLLGYLQPEYAINDKVTVFGRIDTSTSEDNSLYLRLLPAFASQYVGSALGLRGFPGVDNGAGGNEQTGKR